MLLSSELILAGLIPTSIRTEGQKEEAAHNQSALRWNALNGRTSAKLRKMTNLESVEQQEQEHRATVVSQEASSPWASQDASTNIRNRHPQHRSSSPDPSSMTRRSDLARSREGLLKADYEAPLASLNEHYSSGSDLDLDELEPHDGPTSPSMRGGWSPSKRRRKQKPSGLPAKRKGGWLRNNKPLFIISTILLGGLLAILGMLFGGVFKIPDAPPDGVSVPFLVKQT